MNPEIDHIRADRLGIMKILATSDPLVAKPFCERMNLLCHFGADAARIPYPGTNGNMSLEIWEKAMRREAWGAQGGDALSKRGETIEAGPVIGDGEETVVMPVAVFGPKHGGQMAAFGLGDKRAVIIDPSNERWLIDRTRLLYCILGAGASFWWLLGGTILIETKPPLQTVATRPRT